MRAINSPEVVNSLEIERERNKVARFLHTKERMGAMLATRETKIDERIKKMEKKQAEYEKRKRVERKMALDRVSEKQAEWEEKRKKVFEHKKDLEDKSVSDYRKAVRQQKERMRKELEMRELERRHFDDYVVE